MSLKAVGRLQELYETLEELGDEKYISFDLGMVSNYNYYTGIIFKAYTYGVGDTVLRGGRYDKLLSHFGKEAPAIGFMILVDDLMIALDSQKLSPDEEKYIDYLLYDKGMAKRPVNWLTKCARTDFVSNVYSLQQVKRSMIMLPMATTIWYPSCII